MASHRANSRKIPALRGEPVIVLQMLTDSGGCTEIEQPPDLAGASGAV